MKKLFLLSMLAVVCGLLGGCSSDSASEKVRQILATVPDNSAVVAVIDGNDMLENLGATRNGDYFELGADLKAFAEKGKVEITDYVNGNAGINPEVLVFFTNGRDMVLTGCLDDASKFESYMKEKGSAFAEKEGVKVSGSWGIKNDRFWYCSNDNSIVENVNSYCSLKETESMASNPCAEKIEKLDDDVAMLMNMKTISNLSGSNVGLGMAQSFVYQNAETCVFGIDFEKGKIKGEARIYDEKGKDSKVLLDYGTIDLKMLNELKGDYKLVGALSLPKAVVEKILAVFKTMLAGSGVPDDVYNVFSAIDGTLAFGMGASNTRMDDMYCQVSAKVHGDEIEKGLPFIRTLLAMTPVKADVEASGDVLTVKVGNSTGTSNLAQHYDYMKGAAFGCVADLGFFTSTPQLGVLKVRSEVKKDVAFGEMELELGSSSENSALTLLKLINDKL